MPILLTFGDRAAYEAAWFVSSFPRKDPVAAMWRAFFLAIGITLGILGVECLIFDGAMVATPAAIDDARSLSAGIPAGGKMIKPPEWAPWSLLSGGTIVSLYALTLKSSA
ncbi:MAG: hypothetical protein P8N76_03400 [Pirellulaceae bacterium]|nr:hypothetical protein [Pirellulaceae bacterium]